MMAYTKTPAPCGTRAAAVRHRRNGEHPCPPCRQAEAAHTRARRGKPKRRPKEKAWLLSDAVVDWLTVDGGWLTAAGLAVDLGAHPDSIERVLYRLRTSGVVVDRSIPLALAGNKATTEQRKEWRVV